MRTPSFSFLLLLIPFIVSYLFQFGNTEATKPENSNEEAWIVFGSFRGGDFSSSVHAIRPDGTGEHQLSPHPKGLPGSLDPKVSPDGRAVVFTRGGDGSHRTTVWRMDSEGTNEHRLTEEVGLRFNNGAVAPAMSPDGQSILYAKTITNPRTIWVMNQDGAEAKVLAEGQFPEWSFDGKQIAFARKQSDTNQVWVMNSDGSNQHPLTSGRQSSHYPNWSPDGTQIVFSRVEGETYDLYVMNADGSNVRRLTRTPDYSERNAAWSPDGSMIAYATSTPDAPDGWQRSIFVMNADGTDQRRVSSLRYHDTSPSWLQKK